MSGIAVPNWLADQMTRKQYMEKRDGFREVEKALMELDIRLSLVYVGLRVPIEKCPIGALPGRFHIRRDNSEANVPDTFIPIVNQHGEYTDPDLGIVDNLRKQDLWNRNVTQDLKKRWEQEEKEKLAADEAFREEFREALADRYKNKTRPSVSFSDVPWTNKAHGRKDK